MTKIDKFTETDLKEAWDLAYHSGIKIERRRIEQIIDEEIDCGGKGCVLHCKLKDRIKEYKRGEMM